VSCGNVARLPPTEAASGLLWRVHGSLNFVRKLIEVMVQSIEEILLGFVRSKVPDQRGVSRVIPQTFQRRQKI